MSLRVALVEQLNFATNFLARAITFMKKEVIVSRLFKCSIRYLSKVAMTSYERQGIRLIRLDFFCEIIIWLMAFFICFSCFRNCVSSSLISHFSNSVSFGSHSQGSVWSIGSLISLTVCDSLIPGGSGVTNITWSSRKMSSNDSTSMFGKQHQCHSEWLHLNV